MTRPTPKAERQLDNSIGYYAAKLRPAAIRNLLTAVQQATIRVDQAPSAGLRAPRPYPRVVVEGCRWLKQGRYWFICTDVPEPVILDIDHDTANIPDRL